MAHAILAAESTARRMPFRVESAGVLNMGGAFAAAQAQSVCERRGTPMPKVHSTYIGDIDVSLATRVFVMERAHVEPVHQVTGIARERIQLMGELDPHGRGSAIDDPIGLATPAFEECYAILRDCIRNYLDTTRELRELGRV